MQILHFRVYRGAKAEPLCRDDIETDASTTRFEKVNCPKCLREYEKAKSNG